MKHKGATEVSGRIIRPRQLTDGAKTVSGKFCRRILHVRLDSKRKRHDWQSIQLRYRGILQFNPVRQSGESAGERLYDDNGNVVGREAIPTHWLGEWQESADGTGKIWVPNALCVVECIFPPGAYDQFREILGRSSIHFQEECSLTARIPGYQKPSDCAPPYRKPKAKHKKRRPGYNPLHHMELKAQGAISAATIDASLAATGERTVDNCHGMIA
jgi:hypothetical protein